MVCDDVMNDVVMVSGMCKIIGDCDGVGICDWWCVEVKG